MRRKLDHFLEEARKLSEHEFAVGYGAPVLIPIGLDAVILRESKTDETALVERTEVTAVQMGPHPLAGHVLVLDDGTGQGGSFLFGRAENNDVMVPDSSVSQRHCQVLASPHGVMLVDLGSANGTLLNGRRIVPYIPTPVQDEDAIAFGRYRFQYMRPATFHARLRQMAGDLDATSLSDL